MTATPTRKTKLRASTQKVILTIPNQTPIGKDPTPNTGPARPAALSYLEARVFPTGSDYVPDSGPQKDLQLCNVCLYILSRFFEALHFLFSMGTR